MLQRVISALVMRETDPAQAPLRRGVGAVFAGIMIAVIVAAGFGVYGIFTGVGSNNWQANGSVVVEKETGATFVYSGGVLHPMLNYASALLASDQPAPQTFRVAEKKLIDLPRGVTLGIPGAPNSLPAAGETLGEPWTLCTTVARDVSGNETSTTTLVVGERLSGGRPLGDDGLLATDDQDGTTYLIWHSHYYRIDTPDALMPAMFGAQTAPVAVDIAWLNGLPEGQALASIPVTGKGDPSNAVPGGHSVGDMVYDRTGAGSQYYLILQDGMAPMTQLQEEIQAARTAPPSEVPTNVISQAPKSRLDLSPLGDPTTLPPKAAPKLASATSTDSVCAVSSGARRVPEVVVGAEVAGAGAGIDTGLRNGTGTALADRVVVPPGRIAVVMAMSSPTATTGSVNLVTDTGRRFAVPTSSVLASLGYGPTVPVEIPASLVTRIPEGPTLDPIAALQPAVYSTDTGSRGDSGTP
jgi:type VII secretion protein EccB